MDKEISVRRKRGRIQGVYLVLFGEKLFGLVRNKGNLNEPSSLAWGGAMMKSKKLGW